MKRQEMRKFMDDVEMIPVPIVLKPRRLKERKVYLECPCGYKWCNTKIYCVLKQPKQG